MSKYFIHLHKIQENRRATRTAGWRNENVHKTYIANTQLSIVHWLFDWFFNTGSNSFCAKFMSKNATPPVAYKNGQWSE